MGRAVVPWIVVAAIASWSAGTRLEINNPTGQWKPTPVPPADSLWEYARSQFADAELVIVAVQPSEDELRESMVAAANLEGWIGEQPEVLAVFGPRTVSRLDFELGLPLPGAEISRLQRAVVSDDGSLVRIFAALEPPTVAGSLETKRRFLERLRAKATTILPREDQILLAGKPVLDLALNDLVSQDATRSAPLALATMLVVLLLLLGSSAVPPVLGVIVSIVVLAGLLGLMGIPISTATVTAFPITAVVGLSYGLHATMSIERAGDPVSGLRSVRWPILWAYLTTVAALLGFALSPVPAIRTFAWVTAVGMTVAVAAALTLVPALPPRRDGPRRRLRTPGWIAFQWYAGATRHPRLTVAIWAIGGGLAVVGTSQIRLEPNNYLGFFPSDHPSVVAHEELDRAFGGSVPLYLMATVDSGTASRQARVRTRLASVVEAADEYLPSSGAILPVAPERRALEPLIDRLAVTWFEARDPRVTRAVLALPVMETPRVRSLLADLEALAGRYSDEEVRLEVTGVVPASLPLLEALVETQLRSLATLLAVATAVLVLVVGSLRAGAKLVIPSLLPLLIVGAAMGFLRIPLDFTTVIVFSIVLGVAVDDTLHISMRARRRKGRPGAIPRALRETADAVTFTSIAAVTGFAVLWMSPFPSTRWLGELLSLGLLTAWVADLTLTPLLLAPREPQTRSR